ncbi:hypothetical protein HYV91_02560 [Candidatus Wolfebacteria bacterium]|nr:hypothetical protein [Candidatus Wolfebacteria bacterium]
MNFQKIIKNSKKILTFFILFSNFLFLVPHPLALAAITPGQVPTAGDLDVTPSPVNSPQDLERVTKNATSGFYVSFFILAVLFILIAAYKYLFAMGDVEKLKSARLMLIYAAIAIAVALMAVSFELIIKNFLALPNAGIPNQ